MSATLLIELLTEELPPKSLKKLSETFAAEIFSSLKRDRLTSEGSESIAFATPRRIAVSVTDVLAQAPEQVVELKGPSVAVALDEAGNAKAALHGFAKKCGAPVERLEKVGEGKNAYFVYRTVAPGANLAGGVGVLIEEAANKLPVAKIMRWGDGDAQFVRPVQGVLILHGREQIKIGLFDAAAKQSNTTLGHRFLTRTTPVDVPGADDYEAALERDGKVIARFDRRKQRIRTALEEHAHGATILMSDALLDEVTALTEWPAVYEGTFDQAFLGVPQECLILTMQENQRYFPLAEAGAKLINRFLLVSNIETPEPSQIVHGNERVLRARLADAKFFFEQDKKTKLEARVPRLAKVVYHNKLGSQLERVQRIVKLASAIAARLGADTALAARAAYLCKADLLTEMVGEFPELQGTMGMYYARADLEPEIVARAIFEHYLPRHAGDTLPENTVAASIALAEKLDTLVGIYGLGLIPTGDKDPFGLRRQALGVARVLMETPLALDLRQLLDWSYAQFPSSLLRAEVAVELHPFIVERLKNYLRDKDFDANEIEAVLAQSEGRLDRVLPRLNAVRKFVELPEAQALSAANKRIRNILKGAPQMHGEPHEALLKEPAERALFDAMRRLAPQVDKLVAREDYAQALSALAGIKENVDRFFDHVMVMSDDAELRANRLKLLQFLGKIMNQVADISKLAA